MLMLLTHKGAIYSYLVVHSKKESLEIIAEVKKLNFCE